MEFTIEADERPAATALDRVKSKLSQVEVFAVDSFRRISNGVDAIGRGFIRVGEAIGVTLLAARAARELREAFSLGGLEKENSVLGQTVNLYRGLRLAISATAGSAAQLAFTASSIGIGIAIEKAIEVTFRYGKTLRDIEFQAARTGKSVEDIFAFQRAEQISGVDLSPFKGEFSPESLRAALAEIRGISEPIEQARQAIETFGGDAEKALAILGKGLEDDIDEAVAFARTIDNETRASVLRAQKDFEAFGAILPDIGRGFRTLRDDLERGIAVKVSFVLDTTRGLGRRLDPNGRLSGQAEGGPAFTEPANIVPGLAEILREASAAGLGKAPTNLRASGQAEVALQAESKRLAAVAREYENSVEGLRAKLQRTRALRDRLFTGIETERVNPVLFAPAALGLDRQVRQLEQQIEMAGKVKDAEKQAEELKNSARVQELKGLDAIAEKYQQQLKLYGLSAQAVRDLAEANRVLIAIENQKLVKTGTDAALKASAAGRSNDNRLFFEREAADTEAAKRVQELQNDIAKAGIDARIERQRVATETEIRQLDLVRATTVNQKVAIEQQKAKLEEDGIIKRFALLQENLDRELKAELANMEAIAIARGVSEERIAEQRDAIVRLKAERDKALEIRTQGEIDAVREQAQIRSANIIRDNNQRLFDSFKRQAEGVWDALTRSGESAWKKIGDLFKVTILTALKDVVTSQVAASLTGLVTGQRVSLQSSTGGGGILQRLLGFGGLGSVPVFGAGAPGGTPGFAGPVSAGGGGQGGGSGFSGLLGGGAANGGGILQSLKNLGNIGRDPFGQSVTNGAVSSARGVGGAAGGALLLGGGILGFDGLRRGGLLGLAETTGAGALIGAKFGGPLGAAIGAGIGALAGTIRLFVKGAAEKIVDRVKSVYGVTISKQFASDPLLGIIKQNFGGNVDLGIRSKQVRDLIELYQMSTGQGNGQLGPVQRPATLLQTSGGLFQAPSFANGAVLPSLGGAIPSLPGAPVAAAEQPPVIIQVSVPDAAGWLEGGTLNAVQRNGRVVAQSVNSAARRNIGRIEPVKNAMSPNLVTS